MATQVQWRGGSTSEHATFTGAAREITVDTQKQTLVLHDGSTAGGRALLREDGSNAALALGSADSPSLKFTGDTNTGIYSPGADQVALSTNGTGRLFVDANGQIAAGASLDASISVDTRVLKIGGLNYLAGTNGTSGKQNFKTGLFYNALPTSSANANAIVSNAGSDYLPARYTMFQGTHTWETATSATAGSAITWFERMRVTNAGLVGIGTSGPQSIFDIKTSASNGALSQGAYIYNPGTGENAGAKLNLGVSGGGTIDENRSAGIAGYYNGTGTALGFYTTSIWGTGSQTVRAVINNSGNVGIGTTNPGSLLHIEGTSGSLRLNGTASAFSDYRIGGTNIGYTGDAAFLFSGSSANFGVRATNNLAFGIGASEKARITSSGQLLVGTPTSAGNDALLQVAGNVPLQIHRGINTSSGPSLYISKSRSTVYGSNAIVQSGDQIGQILFLGDDGVDYKTPGASITAEVDGTPGANDMPGRLVFSTTADGAGSPTPRLTIKSTGIVNIANAPTYADNAAATTGGLAVGDVYRTSTGQLMIRY